MSNERTLITSETFGSSTINYYSGYTWVPKTNSIEWEPIAMPPCVEISNPDIELDVRFDLGNGYDIETIGDLITALMGALGFVLNDDRYQQLRMEFE